MIKNYITPDWPAADRVKAFATTRHQGFSNAPFASLNLGFRGGDNPDTVMANRKKLRSDLNLPAEPKWLKQVHGNVVVQADTIDEPPEADASFTRELNVICLAMTADCLPLLVCDLQGTCVAAIHAGWKGLLAGVIDTTLDAMKIDSRDTLVWLGPAIGPTVFEVGSEVRSQFLDQDSTADKAFTAKSKEKWLMNIYLYAHQRLHKRGITQIYGGDRCTYTDAEHFFSYRRDKGITGSLASLIWLSG